MTENKETNKKGARLLSRLIKRRRPVDYLIYAAIIFGCIAVDMITKAVAVAHLAPIRTFPIIKDVLHFTYHENPGAAFGMLQDAPWVFNTVSIVAIAALLLYLFSGHEDSWLRATSLALIIGGGIGNMIERIGQGYVVDFIDFRLINFAIFNAADSFVCVGAGLLILTLVLEIISEARNAKSGEDK